LDPFSMSTIGDLIRFHNWARQFSEAEERLRVAAQLGPPNGELQAAEIELYEATGRIDQCITATNDESLREALKQGGMRAYWRKLYSDISHKTNWTSYVDRAALLLRMGQRDRALEQLYRGYELHDRGLTILKVWAEQLRLDSDPRFKDILQKMHFADK